MKKLILLLIFTLIGTGLFSQISTEDVTVERKVLDKEEETELSSVDLSAGLGFSLNLADIIFSDSEIENTLNFAFLMLEVNVEILDNITLGVIAGYNMNNFSDPVIASELPLSLSLEEANFKSMLFGLNIKAEPFYTKDFTLKVKGEFLYFKLYETSWDINLSVIEGAALVENSFYQLTIDLLFQYDGFSGFALFLGPQLNLVNGSLKFTEEIEGISAESELKFRQRNLIGVVAGTAIELGGNLDLMLKFTAFCKISASIVLAYTF